VSDTAVARPHGAAAATDVADAHDAPKAASPQRRSRRSLGETITAYSFLGPNLVVLGVFLLLPVVWALVISLQTTDGFGNGEFVGAENYRTLVNDADFWRATFNTVLFTAIIVPVSLAIGLGLAVLMNSVLPARPLLRTIIILPMVISGVATGLMGEMVFDQNTGVVNRLLEAVGLGAVSWQSEGGPAFATVVLVTLWWRIGFNMVIYLAGLQSIGPHLYEAARIDGAGPWAQFRHITVAMVGPSTFFLLIMNVIYSLKVFDIVYVLTGGGPGNATSVLVTYAYETGFVIRNQGYAAAIGIVLLVITVAFTAVQWKLSRTRDLVE
jgi:multiple sugar transport system permease protein